MKIRRRLYPEEAKSLGIVAKKEEIYDKGKQPRYTIDRSDWQKIKNKRKKMKKQKENPKQAKIYIVDIETAPTQAYVFGKWKQNIHDDALINDWFILTWSAKELFKDEIYSSTITPEEVANEDDKRVCEGLYRILDDADIIIGHNFQKFDRKKSNSRFLMNGLGCPSSYQIIDTCLQARKNLGELSNKLDVLAKKLGVGKKVEHEGFMLWRKCLEGDTDALNRMQEYNDGDIIINEEVYLKMRPFILPHPNLNLFLAEGSQTCPSCESDKLEPVSEYVTYANTYSEYKCKRCGNRCRANKKHTKLSPLPR